MDPLPAFHTPLQGVGLVSPDTLLRADPTVPVRVFLTVGSQMPFDRLSAAVASWAREGGRGRGHDRARDPEQARGAVMAQLGQTSLLPTDLAGLQWQALLTPPQYEQACTQTDVIVAHAGMGSVLTAMGLGKPLVVMPRRGALRETRNDHQVATARHLRSQPGIWVAMEAEELGPILDDLCERIRRGRCAASEESPQAHIHAGEFAPPRQQLIRHLRAVLDQCR